MPKCEKPSECVKVRNGRLMCESERECERADATPTQPVWTGRPSHHPLQDRALAKLREARALTLEAVGLLGALPSSAKTPTDAPMHVVAEECSQLASAQERLIKAIDDTGIRP
jgi:hypothetical protein